MSGLLDLAILDVPLEGHCHLIEQKLMKQSTVVARHDHGVSNQKTRGRAFVRYLTLRHYFDLHRMRTTGRNC